MENLSQIVFRRIMKFATGNNQLLKQVVRWEKVSRRFCERLMEDFWEDITQISITFFDIAYKPHPMMIQSEVYKVIDVTALGGFKRRGIRSSEIVFFEPTPSDLILPAGLADSTPMPVTHITLGHRQNMNDPQIMKLLQKNCQNVEIIKLYITNRTISDLFVDALLNVKSLKLLSPLSVDAAIKAEFRKSLFYKLNELSVECLMVISKNFFSYECIFGNELFALLENGIIKCLHLRASNHYVERWLATKSLHNRAQITNLCITNSQVSYNVSEMANETAPLYHSFANYKTLFPRLQYLCVGICLAQFDDDRLDSMLSCYYLQNNFNIKLRLTVRLFHKSSEIQLKRFDWIFSKLRIVQAEIEIVCEKTEGRIQIKSRDGKIFTEIFICFYANDLDQLSLEERRSILTPKVKRCVDLDHHSDFSNSFTCLCARNHC